MAIATHVANRSTCLRRTTGAVLVKDKRMLATGYNGVPSGLAHCEVVGCLREVRGIVFREPYPDPLSAEPLAEAGVVSRCIGGDARWA